MILFAEGLDSSLMLLVGAIGTLVGIVFKNLIDYRKVADAGKLALVEAEQMQVKIQLETLRQEAMTAKEVAKECHDNHKKSEIDRAELRGQLIAGKEHADRLHTTMLHVVKENAELVGRVGVLQHQVARDTSETLQLAERHGKNEARIAKLENGGSKP